MQFISELDLADFEDNESTHDSCVGIFIRVDCHFNFFLGKTLQTLWRFSGFFNSFKMGIEWTSYLGRFFFYKCLLRNPFFALQYWEYWAGSKKFRKCFKQILECRKYWSYVTTLPFRPGHEILLDNFSVGEQRLKKLKNRWNLVEKYDQIFKEYEQNKIIEKVPFDEVPKKLGQVHYLWHQQVLREDKEITKICAAFDASCASDGASLNNCLYSGPNLVSKIFDILLRFRVNFIATLADIKQEF